MSLPTPTSGAVYNAANELTQWNGVNLTYDANGNLTGDGLNNYTWNERNQLATVKDANNGATLASFVYDPFGRRLQNSAGDGVLYDGANEVQELSGTTPMVNRLTGGVDEFFSRTDSAGTAFPLTDALGSTIALTDTSGTVQTQYTYDPFGGSTSSGAMSSNTYQFTGRVNDGTGLYYYRARYYSPRFQRFISEDPLGLRAGTNLYAYVNDSPMVFTDPSGKDAISGAVTGAIFGALGASGGSGWDVAGGAIAGGVVGFGAGFFLPPGPLTGAAAGAAGDLAGQELGNALNGQSLGNVNWGEASGAGIGGATAGGIGQYLNDLAGSAGLGGKALDWATDVIGGNLGLMGGLLGGGMAGRKCR